MFHLKFCLVFLGSSVHMLTPQQNPASACATVILEKAGSKIQTRKRYYREDYNNTHTSDFIKKGIMDVTASTVSPNLRGICSRRPPCTGDPELRWSYRGGHPGLK